MREATKLIMFTGNMNGLKYGKLVETGLVPFTRTTFPDGHWLQQDNDPKHCNDHIKMLFKFHDMF